MKPAWISVISFSLAIAFLFLIPGPAEAGLTVNVYFAGGLVIAGVSITLVFFFGGGHYSKKDGTLPEALYAYSEDAPPGDAGMVKVLRW